jgi:type 1 fimbria pilin
MINGVGLSIIQTGQGINVIRGSTTVDVIGNSFSMGQAIPFDVYYQRQSGSGPVTMPGAFMSMANFTLTYQ